MRVTVEFSGGAELLFGGVKQHSVTLPEPAAGAPPWTMERLLPWIKDNLLKERPELFIQVGDARVLPRGTDNRPGDNKC